MVELLPAWAKAGVVAAALGSVPLLADAAVTAPVGTVVDLHSIFLAGLGGMFGLLAYFVRRTLTQFEMADAKKDGIIEGLIARLDGHGKSIVVLEAMCNTASVKEAPQLGAKVSDHEHEIKALRDWRHGEQNTVQAMLLQSLGLRGRKPGDTP